MSLSLLILCSIHAALWVAAPLLSTRILTYGPISLMMGMPVAIIAYGTLDLINQGWGATVARKSVLAAVFVRGIIWSIFALSGIPLLYEGLRIAIAGEVQLILSQYLLDITVFDWVRRKAGPFWLRYMLSNILSESLSLLIIIIGSYAFTGRPLLPIFLGGLLLRLTVTTLLTPLFSLFARWIK